MSQPVPPLPVKPVVSLILARDDLTPRVMARLSDFFGPPDLVGPWWEFSATDYYAAEMGPGLGRRLVSFLHLADSRGLAHWKLFTNSVESDLTLGGRRLVNLDPGYVSRERLVLATGKNFAHRIYLGRGIFGDLALTYSRGSFKPLPWSYPDYSRGDLPELLGLVRRKYLWQLGELSDLR
ncbi:MAG: DUF4416 family protein [Deltaproteobacteria bacterium]|nr:DUF4416 family protein [Deltaproteobacteria bacterium]